MPGLSVVAVMVMACGGIGTGRISRAATPARPDARAANRRAARHQTADLPGPGRGRRHEVFTGLDAIRAATAQIAAARTWSMSDAEVRETVRAGAAAVAGLEAAWLGLVRDLDGRPEAVAGARPGTTAATFLIHALRVSNGRAHADVAAAHAIDPDTGQLPALGAAMAAGQVSRGHLDVAVRTLTRVPARLATTFDQDGVSGAERIDAFLTEHSRHLPPTGTDRLARHLLATLNPEALDRYDPDAFTRRALTCAVDATGMLIGRFHLDPAAGAAVKAALDHYAAPTPPTPAEDRAGEQTLLIGDDRTRPQRYADALTTIARTAAQRRRHHPRRTTARTHPRHPRPTPRRPNRPTPTHRTPRRPAHRPQQRRNHRRPDGQHR